MRSFLNVVAEKILFADEEYKRRRYARTDCSCDSTSEPKVCNRIQNDGAEERKERRREGYDSRQERVKGESACGTFTLSRDGNGDSRKERVRRYGRPPCIASKLERRDRET